MNRNCLLTIVVAITLALCCFTVHAKKPDKPDGGNGGGGGGDSNGGGVIYFRYNQNIYSMNDDGSGVTLLDDFATGFNRSGDPSHELHAGKRWFIQYYASTLVALSDAGDAVVFDVGPGIELVGSPRWANEDAFISFEGRYLDNDGNVVEGGLYAVSYAVDADGNLTGADGNAVLLFSAPLYDNSYGTYPNIASHSWTADGLRFVYHDRPTDNGILIGDLLTGTSTILFYDPSATTAHSPTCSAADKVMFQYNPDKGHSRVMVINLNGLGLKMIARGSPSWSKGVGVWSPTGSHLLYHHSDHFFVDSYILRASSTGSGKTRLTDQSMGAGMFAPRAMGWRN